MSKLSRRDEIVDACAKLYETKNFREITIKDIGELLEFGRSSIYNYFQTKEEIFLMLLQKEYDLWTNELHEIIAGHEKLSPEDFAKILAHSLEHRPRLLKLLSMNHFDMEEGSRPERLTEFKLSFGASMKAVEKCLEKFFPSMTKQNRQEFIYSFFPFIYGIYPYTVVTEKQSEAMKKSDVNYVYMSVYEMAFSCAKKLLGVKE